MYITLYFLSLSTIILYLLFSLILTDIKIPFPVWSRDKGCYVTRMPVFQLYPVGESYRVLRNLRTQLYCNFISHSSPSQCLFYVMQMLLTTLLGWLLCWIFTITDVFDDDPNSQSYLARTDARSDVMESSKLFFFPYPGRPTLLLEQMVYQLFSYVHTFIIKTKLYYNLTRLLKCMCMVSGYERDLFEGECGYFRIGRVGYNHITCHVSILYSCTFHGSVPFQ